MRKVQWCAGEERGDVDDMIFGEERHESER